MNDSDDLELSDSSHYEVLGLKPGTRLTAKDVKSAYHQALLRHHPDKSPRNPGNGVAERDEVIQSSDQRIEEAPIISIDRLTLAYQTLSDPQSKAEYDRLLALSTKAAKNEGLRLQEAHRHLGVDIVDLEDMDYDDDRSLWKRPCRCGDRWAYEITEPELEREQSHGEIYVGCRGCSLFIKVIFEAVDDEGVASPESSTGDRIRSV